MKHTHIVAIVFAAVLAACSTVAAQNPERYPAAPSTEKNGYSQDPQSEGVPPVLTLPTGTLVTVRTTQPLSSDRNKPGDSFTAVLDRPIIAQGWVVARRGQIAAGRVVAAQKAGRGNASSQLALELDELSLVDGQPLPIRTELAEIAIGSPSRPRNEGAAVGATTGTGAVIGAIAGGGPGAAIGAAIGAAAGVAGVLSTRGKATEIRPETQMTFRLQNAASISTAQSRHAFLPVNRDDYPGQRAVRNPDRYPAVRSYPPRPFRYYDYDLYDSWYAAPYGRFSIYVGPRYYVGSRVYVRPPYRWRR